MEIWTPLRAHAEWITLFRETLYGSPVRSPYLLNDPRLCEVGRWLARHEDILGHLPEYRDAVDVHAKFHRRAAYSFRLAAAGRKGDALGETADTGELRLLSRRLVKTFQNLKRVVRQEDLPISWDIDPPHSLPSLLR